MTDFWKGVCDRLSDNQLLMLYRGAIIAEREFRLQGGSVSSNQWILELLSARLSPKAIHDVCVWALDNCLDDASDNYWTRRAAKQGVPWAREAAEQEHAGAQFNLGVAYHLGDGVEQDSEQGVAWTRSAADVRRKKKAEFHVLRTEAAIKGRVALHSELGRVAEMDMPHRMQWFTETALPVDAIPHDLFAIDEICARYQGTPDLGKITNRIGNRKRHWRRLADALAAARYRNWWEDRP